MPGDDGGLISYRKKGYLSVHRSNKALMIISNQKHFNSLDSQNFDQTWHPSRSRDTVALCTCMQLGLVVHVDLYNLNLWHSDVLHFKSYNTVTKSWKSMRSHAQSVIYHLNQGIYIFNTLNFLPYFVVHMHGYKAQCAAYIWHGMRQKATYMLFNLHLFSVDATFQIISTT